MQKVEEDKTIPSEPQAQTTTLSIRTSEGGKGRRFLRIWLPLFVHFALALVVAVLVATKLNGYKALAYDWQSRFQPGNNYVLRVSDITTLLSAATTVINFFGGMWTGLIAWRCVFLLLQNDGLTVNRISSILGGTPPLRWPRGLEWAVVIILFFIFPQDYIEPLFSGSVNWNFAIQYGLPYQVGGGSPTASSSLWYWYLTQRVTRLMSTRQAEGLASISWTSTDVQTAVNGTGGIYGGISCRSVMSDTVPVNSTIENAVVPCIQIHSITWPNETVPADIEYYTSTSNGNLSIIGDTPFFDYEHGGVTVIFDRERPVWDTYYNIYNQPAFSISAQYAPFPNATIYHGSMAVVVFLLRQEANGCNPVAGQSFGNTNPFGPTGYINEHFGINPFPGFANTQENCFVYGTVNFTAGVVRAPSSTFVSPRVVEYYPPGVDVANEASVVSAINQASNTIEPSIWTREALWLMPDVMTSLAVMNSSGIPTWMNLENYTSTLIRQAYFASWDMLHSTFEQNDTSTLTVYPAEDRLQASVSSARLFAWLGVTCLVPMTGFLLAYLYRKHSKRGLLVDEVGILLTDPAGVISKYPEVSAMSRVVHADEEMGRIVMDQTGGGSAQFRLSLKTEMS